VYNHPMIESLRHALRGFHWLISNQRNFRIHLAISLFVLVLAFILRVTKVEFAILIFCIILGLAIEMINSAFEEIADLITIKWAKQAKIAKDVTSSMMLFASFGLFLIGLIIFLPYIF